MYGARLLARLFQYLTEPSHIVNVGMNPTRGYITQTMVRGDHDVTGFSLLPLELHIDRYTHRQERFEYAEIEEYDALWCSHTLEHAPNVGLFLTQCRKAVKPGGWVCIVVPSDPTNLLVDGHLSFWTPAHLIYNMVHAGFDCSEAMWYCHERDIGLMVRRKDAALPNLIHDFGELATIRQFFPCDLIHRTTNPWLPDNF